MFERPSLQTLIERVRSDVLTRLSTDDVLRHSDAEVLARAQAGAIHGLYGYLAWLSLQLLPSTATDWLHIHGSTWGVERNGASRASGNALFQSAVGSFIPMGTLLRSAKEVQYKTTVEVTTTEAITAIPVQAVIAGESGNLAASSPLALIVPVDGVLSSVTAGEISGGADIEELEAYRARILTRIRQTPQGGASHDYTAWAKEIPGVTRAWCYPEELGPGSVTVRFVRDDDADLIPDGAEVTTVAQHIEAKRPVTGQLVVVAPVAAPITFQIQGLNPSTAAVRLAIESSLRALLRREAEPGGTVLISHVREAISTASEEYDHVLVSPAADMLHGTGCMATFGGITWL